MKSLFALLLVCVAVSAPMGALALGAGGEAPAAATMPATAPAGPTGPGCVAGDVSGGLSAALMALVVLGGLVRMWRAGRARRAQRRRRAAGERTRDEGGPAGD